MYDPSNASLDAEGGVSELQYTSINSGQLANALEPRYPPFSVTVVSLEQSLNARVEILGLPSMVTEVRPVQPWNAPSSMPATLDGMVMEVRPEQP